MNTSAFGGQSRQRFITPAEIREATGVARGSIGVVLSRLEARSPVEHRGEYWAIADPSAATTTLSASASARGVTERFGGEDPDAWRPGVESRGVGKHDGVDGKA